VLGVSRTRLVADPEQPEPAFIHLETTGKPNFVYNVLSFILSILEGSLSITVELKNSSSVVEATARKTLSEDGAKLAKYVPHPKEN